MSSRLSVRVGVVASVAALLASAALATHPPVNQGPRPGPYAYEVAGTPEPLEFSDGNLVNQTTGALASLMHINAGPYEGSPEAVAKTYLQKEAAAFALTHAGVDLVLDQVRNSPGNVHVRLSQAVDGVRVWGAGVIVTLDQSGRFVRSASSEYDPVLAGQPVSTLPLLDAEQAERAARAAVWITPETPLAGEAPAPALWILRQDDRIGSAATLAWRVCLPIFSAPRGDWEVFVDAQNGSILRVTDRTQFTDGSGYSFDPDPLTTARVAYGTSGYVDGNDANTPQLEAQAFLRTLRDLSFYDGVYHLEGPWVFLGEFDDPPIIPVTHADPDGFTHLRNQGGFEDVSAYFHIDQSQRYIQSLGFFDIQYGPIDVDSHGWDGQDQSSYTPSLNLLSFGEGGVDDAEDADVLLHEYGHAILNSIVPGWGTSTQAQSMGEGTGDYWAVSYSASISDYHDTWVFNWDGHNPYWAGRTVSSTLGYNSLNGDIYHDGTIWASVWWLIRGEMGRAVSDTDYLKLYHSCFSGSGMRYAARQAMLADLDLYDGLHAGTLDYYFTLRQFFTDTEYDVPVLTHTPLTDQTEPGPYPLTVLVTATGAIVDGTVKVKFGTGTAFDQEVVLTPTGNPNEWGGAIPDQGPNADIRYYLVGSNASWPGTAPRGAEYQYYQFHAEYDASAASDQAGARELKLEPGNPNPFPGHTALRFELAQSGNVRLAILDVCGRMVRTRVDSRVEAGDHTYAWDGRNDAGQDVPSGLYFIRLYADDQTRTRKVLLAR